MFLRRTSGSVVCNACGRLVGVNDQRCYNCGAWNPGLWGYAPILRRLGYNIGFVPLVIWGCAAIYAATLLYDPAGIEFGGLTSILGPSSRSVVVFGASGTIPVFGLGRWWTLLTAAWLHGGALHILFNMMWIRQLGPVTAEIYGTSRLIIIYTLAGITGFLFSTLAGIPLTLGASAPLFGLFGALVWAGRRTGSSELGRQALIYAIILLVFGFLMPHVDNFAHIGGFIGGFLTAMLLDPLKRENFYHLVAGLVCIAATVLSLFVSVVSLNI